MKPKLARVAERDSFTCWICRGEVDPSLPASLPGAPTLDHVIPLAEGGSSDESNLRLAHARCNRRRGSALPELRWPDHLFTLQRAPLWQAAKRAQKRPGEWEVVALLSPSLAAEAREWLESTLTLLLPSFEVDLLPGTVSRLRLRAV